MSGKLFIVATPIGNLEDISPRAARVLGEADFIAAEDTRVTIKLLNHLGIKKPMVSYYEQNSRRSGEEIINRIEQGETCALVSDAGLPGISDPGAGLVDMCRQRGIETVIIPGACALVSAVALSGFAYGRFTFEGFLSMNKRTRREHLKSLVKEPRDMVFYEAPHKLESTLADLLEYLGDRRISISRELTKLHEETLRMTLSQAASYFTENPPRGEFVLVVEGYRGAEETVSAEDAAALAVEMMGEGISLKEAARKAAAQTGTQKNAVYAAALKLIR